MGTFYKRIELVANVAIIVVAILLGVVLVKRLMIDRPAASHQVADAHETVAPGTKVSLPGFDWSKKDSHVVLVLQKGCHFCSESAPFYQRLARAAATRSDLQLIAALPQNESEARQYLTTLQVPIDEVRQTDLASIGVRGTPTLLLVDKNGAVVDQWVGKLPPDKESEVLNRLQIKL